MARATLSDPTKVTRASARALVGGKPRKKITYRTEAEKREVREAHRETLTEALARLETPQGMSRWLVSRHIHGTNQTPANIALAAMQAPGQLVGTYQQWAKQGLKPRKGQEHELVLTGRTFWPVAAWGSSSYSIEMPTLPVPDAEHCARLAASWLSWPDHSTQGLDAWVEDARPTLVEGEAIDPEPQPEIPF
jgi:hypothetical protein